MPRPYYSVDSPDLFSSVQSQVSRYATPEAAQRDFEWNAPRTNDEYIKRYQALTGDAFADPWEDQINRHTRELTEAATHTNIGVATGGNTGPSITMAAPMIPGAQGPNETGGPGIPQRRMSDSERVATLQSLLPNAPHAVDPLASTPLPTYTRGSAIPNIDQDAVRMKSGISPTAFSGDYTGLPAAPEGISLGSDLHSDLPRSKVPHSPFALSDSFQEAQRQRANKVGAGNLFDILREQNPEALEPVDLNNPALQLDEKGKPIAGDVINPHLFNDANFQKLKDTQPKAAAAFYHAITGRDLEQDVTAQRTANSNRLDIRTELVKNFVKHGDYDQFGEPFIREFVSDGFGGQKEVQRPLSFGEKHSLEQAGGLRSVMGVEAPTGPDLGRATPAARTAVIGAAKEWLKEHPGESMENALLAGKDKIVGRQKPVSKVHPEDSGMPWIFRGADFYGPFANMGNKMADAWFNLGDQPKAHARPVMGAPMTQEEVLTPEQVQATSDARARDVAMNAYFRR